MSLLCLIWRQNAVLHIQTPPNPISKSLHSSPTSASGSSPVIQWSTLQEQDGGFSRTPSTLWTRHLQSPSCRITLRVLLQGGFGSFLLTASPGGIFPLLHWARQAKRGSIPWMCQDRAD